MGRATTVAVGIAALLFQDGIISYLFPYGFPDYVPLEGRVFFGSIDPSNKSLMKQSTSKILYNESVRIFLEVAYLFFLLFSHDRWKAPENF